MLLLRGILSCILLLAVSQAQAGAPSASIAPVDLRADVAVLRAAYETLHPGLYRYNNKAEMDGHFAALEKSLEQAHSLQDAYLAFSVFAATIKCGHTYANFFNQEKAIQAALFQGHDRLPFYFRWLDRRMIVIDDFTPGQQLARGTEVLSINGIPTQAILDRLMTVARADGSNDAKRIASLEVTGDSVYETFDIYFPMFFPQSDPWLKLEVRVPGASKPQTLTVGALTYEQRIAPIKQREANRKGGDAAIFDWKYLSDGSAYLRMPTWALYDSKWDWKSWLNAKLDELATRNSPALIIDLRGNEGGNDVGDEILKRLLRSDLRISAYRRLVRYRQTPADLNSYLDTWDPSFKNWGDSAVELRQPWPTAPPVHYFALTRYDHDAGGGDTIHPSDKPYRGKVFVLINANNSSATFQFALVMQRNKLGTLVGQPTGGNQRGINGGSFFFLRLPKSHIELDLPLVGTFPAVPQPDAGLTPDVLVTPTVEDILKGRDAEMAAVAALLRK